jgi:glycyl-tRNA synthetase beta subunit
LIEHDVDFDLADAVRKSAKTQPIEVNAETQAKILEFITGRLKVVLNDMDASHKYDVIDAVLAAQSNNPAGTVRAVKQLQAWTERADWSSILDGYARCVRILRSQTEDRGRMTDVSEKILNEPEEKGLYKAIQASVLRPPSSVDEFLEIVATLIPSITSFFEKILVMAEEKDVRENRLGLLQRIAKLADGVADLSKLEGF